jgi:hypothetical protein
MRARNWIAGVTLVVAVGYVAIPHSVIAQVGAIMGIGSNGLPAPIGAEGDRLKVSAGNRDDAGNAYCAPAPGSTTTLAPGTTVTCTQPDGGSAVSLTATSDASLGTAATPMRTDPTGTTEQPVVHGFVTLDTTKIGDCTTTAGDGGYLTLLANTRYRCVARNNAVCVNNGAAVTTCSMTAPLAPNGAYVPVDAPEEMGFPATFSVDAGANNGKALIYLSTPSGTACFSCNAATVL